MSPVTDGFSSSANYCTIPDLDHCCHKIGVRFLILSGISFLAKYRMFHGRDCQGVQFPFLPEDSTDLLRTKMNTTHYRIFVFGKITFPKWIQLFTLLIRFVGMVGI